MVSVVGSLRITLVFIRRYNVCSNTRIISVSRFESMLTPIALYHGSIVVAVVSGYPSVVRLEGSRGGACQVGAARGCDGATPESSDLRGVGGDAAADSLGRPR
jgi:hypothetical protein